MIKWLGLPEQASAHASQIDQMIVWVHVMMLILGLGWGLFYLFTLFRFRGGRNPKADYKGVRNNAATYLALAVAAVEAVLLVGVSLPLWDSIVVELPEEDEAVVVRVVAQQFQWNVHYPGADGVFGRTDVKLMDDVSNPIGLDRSDPAAVDDFFTINQMHLPVDKPALIYLSSKDVIHCFSLPIMRVKQDIVPGMRIPTSFTPIKTGQSEIACAQLCGLGHYRMRGYLTIQTQAEYESWLAEQAAALLEEAG